MGRNDEISIPKFCNYTDLREKKISQAEVESIKAYARGLNKDRLGIFLAEITDEELISELNRRLIHRRNKLGGIVRYLDGLA